MLCQLLLCFCQRKFNSVSKVFLEGYLKDFHWQNLSLNGMFSWQNWKNKRAVAFECCQKWRKTRHLGFSHYHSRELSIRKKWAPSPALSVFLFFFFFNKPSHVLTMHTFFFHTRCSWIMGCWQNNRTQKYMTSSPSSKRQMKAQSIGRTCLRLQTWCSG